MTVFAKSSLSRLIALTAMLTLLPAGAAFAGPGDPDTTFGTGGVALTSFGNAARYRAVAALGDGSTIVAGDVTGSGYIVQHLNATGHVDTSFGLAGTAPAVAAPADSWAAAVAVQGDGKIVVVGTMTPTGTTVSRLFVTRFTATGALDTNFGSGGTYVLESSVARAATGTGVAIEPSGKILAVGSVVTDAGGDTSTMAVQLNSDGTPDAGWGVARQPGVSIGPTVNLISERFTAAAVDKEGRLLVTGDANDGGGFIERINPANGLPDTTFAAGDGRIGLAAGRSDVTSAVVVDSSDRVLVLGHSLGNHALVLERLTSAGALDTTFDPAGGASSPPGTEMYNPNPFTSQNPTSGPASVDGLAIAPDKLIYVTGDEVQASVGQFFATRFTDTGQPDASYEPAAPGGPPVGTTTVNAGDGNAAYAYGATLNSTGHLVLVGSAKDVGQFKAAAVRLGGTTSAPVAVPKVTYQAVHAGAPIRPGQAITLDATGSTDPQPGATDAYHWDTDGNGTFDATGPTVNLTAPVTPGDYNVALKVTSTSGLSKTAGLTYSVVANTPPVIDSIGISPNPQAGKPVTFSGYHHDDGSVVHFSWTFIGGAPSTVDGNAATVSTTFPEQGQYAYTLVATDDEGATSSKTGVLTVADAPCDGTGDEMLGNVHVTAVVPQGSSTCLHVSTTTDKGKTTTTIKSTGEITVNGITITPDGGIPAKNNPITIVSVKSGGKRATKLDCAAATVHAVANEAPITFDHGKVAWDLSGDRIEGFKIQPSATIGGLKLSSDPTLKPTIDQGGTSTIQMTPHLPANFTKTQAGPANPVKVVFGEKGQFQGDEVRPTVATAADANNPCSKKVGNGGFDFCVQNIPLGVAQVNYIHVYYDPHPGFNLWGGEASLTVNVGDEGPFTASAGIEFRSDANNGDVTFHAGYLQAGGSGQTLIDTIFFQLHKVAFQINAGPDFATTDLSGAEISSLGGPSDGKSLSGTCVDTIGRWNMYIGQPDPNPNNVPPQGGTNLLIDSLNQLLAPVNGVPAGTALARQDTDPVPHNEFRNPWYVDFGTPDLAFCGQVDASVLEVIGINLGLGYAHYPVGDPAYPNGAEVFWFSGQASLADLVNLDISGELWSTGYVHVFAGIDAGIDGVAQVKGSLDIQANKHKYNVEGKAEVTVLGMEAGADILASSKGFAGCLILDFFGNKWSPGVEGKWGHLSGELGGCDVGPYRVTVSKSSADFVRERMTRAPHAIAHTAAAASDFTVTPGTPGITAVMTGDTAPPHVVLVDPHGRTYDTGAGNDPVDGNGEIALKDPDHNMTEIAVWSPAPGHWSVMPAADSSALTSTKYALGMRQPTVTAHVRGQGYTRALAYKTTGLQPGDTVTFTESGHGGQFIATLPKVPAGAKQTADGLTRTGLINFTPAIGPSELRNVIATVVGADGVPRASINLGVYKSPPAATPARVTDVKFALSKRGRLAVGWTQPHGVLPVQTYNVLVKLSDGRVITFLPRSPRVTVTGVHSGERVTATIAGVSAAGTTSRARTVHARVHVPGARKHKNRPRRKHRPQIPR